MSISMERFGLAARPGESRPGVGVSGIVFPYRLQCRACGFEPDNAIQPPIRCPKCAGSAWERFAFPGSLLLAARRPGIGTGLNA